MNNIDRQYKELLQQIIHFGVEKKDRTGTGTKSIFGWQIRHNMKEGFPLLTTKKMAWKSIVTELLWFLRGDTNIKYLVDNDCHIWDGDAYKNYLHKVIRDKDIVRYLKSYSIDTKGVPTIEPYSKDEFIDRIKNDEGFAKKWGELGPIYGAQWREWGSRYETNNILDTTKRSKPGIDQIQNLINELKTNPDSRRLMVNAWNVSELDQMILPPCHYGFQCYVREGKYLSLMWNQRSVDTFLGLPFNIASYGLLLMMIADEVGMIPDELIGNLGDCHLYNNHIEQAAEQCSRHPYELPTVHVRDGIESFMPDDIILENYQSHPPIKAPLSN